MLKEIARLAARRPTSDTAYAGADEARLLLETFEASSQGWLWSVDHGGRIRYISDSVAQLLGSTQQTLIGASFADIFAQADDDDLSGRRAIPFLLAKRSKFERIMLRPTQEDIHLIWAVSGTPVFDGAGQFTGYRGSAIDVTEHRRSSAHASQLAKYDALTGLPNRLKLAEVLESQINQAQHQNRPCTIMLLDLDRFKQVNDTLGHPAGDALLKQVAERLVRIVGDRERVFRLGGDEFQVVLSNCADKELICTLASSIISSASQPYSIEGSNCVIGVSIGVATAPFDGTSRLELVRNADLALYFSKSSGRGQFSFFSTSLLAAAEEKRALEEDLRDALARDQITLAYQPIVDTRTNEITGVEALLRWEHPLKGAISPSDFIPIAEEAGIIGQLGDWVLRKACEDAASWPGSLRLAVNVSPIQFTDALPAIVVSALATSGLAADRLELEITEGVFLSNTPKTDAIFAAMKKIGVRLALDDFGTGYSSLGYLRTAPFDKIKIDQSFVREATSPESRNAAIIAAIVALAEALGMETTAEGVEYMDQLELVRRLRVSHAQGWIYSSALSSEQLRERLKDGHWAIEPSGPAKQRSNRQSVYRKVGIIHGNRYRSAIVRNLSASGALLEGARDLPLQALVIVDFGDGELSFGRVMRHKGNELAIQFEQELVDDGSGRLSTSARVSPYLLASARLPKPGEPDTDLTGVGDSSELERFAQGLGLTLLARRPEPVPLMNLHWSPAGYADEPTTFKDLSKRYLDSLSGDELARDKAEQDLSNYILPQFANVPLSKLRGADFSGWLSSLQQSSSSDRERLTRLFGRMWSLAADLRLVDADSNPLAGSLRFDRRGQGDAVLCAELAGQLLSAAKESSNRQLNHIVALLMLTGARTGEILNVRWEHIDLSNAVWRVHVAGVEESRELTLTAPAIALLERLPRFEGCPYVVPNRATRRPFRSLTQSWEVVKAKAKLSHLELDDLRYCDFDETTWNEQLSAFLDDDESLKESCDALQS